MNDYISSSTGVVASYEPTLPIKKASTQTTNIIVESIHNPYVIDMVI